MQEGAYIGKSQNVREEFFRLLNEAVEKGESALNAKVETDAQFQEICDHLESYMNEWYAERMFSRGSYGWARYQDSRVYCISDLSYE